MNIKEIVNISRYLDNILITSLSNIVLDYIIPNTECVSCDRKFNYINDYPYFKIVSVDISKEYPKYIKNGNQYIQNDKFDKIKNKNFVEFENTHGEKLKFLYDPVNNLIYEGFYDRHSLSVGTNISGKEDVKILYKKCIEIEQKRLQLYKDVIGITLKNKDLFKYLKLPRDYDGGYDIDTSIKLFDRVEINYLLEVREGNIFKFVGKICDRVSPYVRIGDFSEIVLEGIY